MKDTSFSEIVRLTLKTQEAAQRARRTIGRFKDAVNQVKTAATNAGGRLAETKCLSGTDLHADSERLGLAAEAQDQLEEKQIECASTISSIQQARETLYWCIDGLKREILANLSPSRSNYVLERITDKKNLELAIDTLSQGINDLVEIGIWTEFKCVNECRERSQTQFSLTAIEQVLDERAAKIKQLYESQPNLSNDWHSLNEIEDIVLCCLHHIKHNDGDASIEINAEHAADYTCCNILPRVLMPLGWHAAVTQGSSKLTLAKIKK